MMEHGCKEIKVKKFKHFQTEAPNKGKCVLVMNRIKVH